MPQISQLTQLLSRARFNSQQTGSQLQEPSDLAHVHNLKDLTKSLRITDPQCAKGSFAIVDKGVLVTTPCQERKFIPAFCRPREVPVAIKKTRTTSLPNVLREAGERLVHEARVWHSLKHENILLLLGVGYLESELLPVLVSPWMENGSLDEYLKQVSLTTRAEVQLLSQIIMGLEYLHSKGVTHCDLTSFNVLINQDGRALLSDFGLSRSERFSDTAPQFKFGATRWAAPEFFAALGDPPSPTFASDMYSFGCVMLQVVTGKQPYHWLPKQDEVIWMKERGQSPIIPFDPVFFELLSECLSEDPSARPSSSVARSRIRDLMDM
ncbi:hypothetical protein HYDPIDRAFT_189691 [Hydnomerulius pinastri MD-312]|uniref:Protein kinase domain-containing protein n=1 Tax=Hydnomerulius pinastri MD-312 TaxID=994086 RepID=A0A0C9V627_9AGAM|nr:hypothetical protein HYDPIDRAFT_189691 [Hydnomerulius pinastri MD-312]